MKLEINDITLVDEIVEKLAEKLRPFLNNSYKPKDSELMDVKGLAEYLKVKESWIYEKVHKRKIPFRKVGKFPRFPKKHIDLWTLNPYDSDLNIYNLNL